MNDGDKNTAITCWWAPVAALAVLFKGEPAPVRQHALWSLVCGGIVVATAIFILSLEPISTTFVIVSVLLLGALDLCALALNTRAIKRDRGPFFRRAAE